MKKTLAMLSKALCWQRCFRAAAAGLCLILLLALVPQRANAGIGDIITILTSIYSTLRGSIGGTLIICARHYAAAAADGFSWPRDAAGDEGRTTSTGMALCVNTLTVSLPSTMAEIPRRPCEAMTMRSQPFCVAVSIMP